MPRRKCGSRKRHSGGANDINPAPYPRSIMAQGHQPSHAIMRWATTAGIPTPAKMYNVAHGGKRSTKRKRSKRTRKHRGGNCGPCGMMRQ